MYLYIDRAPSINMIQISAGKFVDEDSAQSSIKNFFNKGDKQFPEAEKCIPQESTRKRPQGMDKFVVPAKRLCENINEGENTEYEVETAPSIFDSKALLKPSLITCSEPLVKIGPVASKMRSTKPASNFGMIYVDRRDGADNWTKHVDDVLVDLEAKRTELSMEQDNEQQRKINKIFSPAKLSSEMKSEDVKSEILDENLLSTSKPNEANTKMTSATIASPLKIPAPLTQNFNFQVNKATSHESVSSDPGDYVKCERCSKSTAVWDLQEHMDEHLARDLQRETNATLMAEQKAKSKNKTLAKSPLMKFFKKKS